MKGNEKKMCKKSLRNTVDFLNFILTISHELKHIKQELSVYMGMSHLTIFCSRLPSSWCVTLRCGQSTPSRRLVQTPTQRSSTFTASGHGPSFPTYQCLLPSFTDSMSLSAYVRYGRDPTNSRMSIRLAYMPPTL